MSLNQRSIIVCDPRLQYRSLSLPLIVTVTTAVTLCVLFTFLAGGLEEFGGDEAALKDAIGRVQLQVMLAAAAVVVVHVILVGWLGLLASHRVAGPIYRIRKSMEAVTKGNMDVRIRLRDHDKLVEVADAFNEMMDTLAARAAPDKPKEEEQGAEKIPDV